MPLGCEADGGGNGDWPMGDAAGADHLNETKRQTSDSRPVVTSWAELRYVFLFSVQLHECWTR